MIHKTLPQWILKGLAGLGVFAIIVFLGNTVSDLLPRATGSSYPGFNQEISTMDSVGPAQEVMFASKSIAPAPEGRLYDESIAEETDSKIIQTGNLSLVVDHADESIDALTQIVLGHEGFVQSSSLYEQEDGTKSGYITIRVPFEQFTSTMTQAKGLALVVKEETTSSSDVTEDYIDLAARLKNAVVQEERYVAILDKASTVEDILKIESALGSIRSQIESLTGRLQYMDSQTDFSTIYISLSEEPVVTIGGKEFRPGTTVKEAIQSVVAIAQGAVMSIIWIFIVGIGVGVPALILGVIAWKLVHKFYQKMKR